MTLIKKHKSLARRTLLRGMLGGASAVVALPLLEAMLDDNGEALADGSGLPCRLLTYFFGNGFGTGPGASAAYPDANYLAQYLEPATLGSAYEPRPFLQPFFDRGVNQHVSLLTGFDVKTPFVFGHHEGMTAFNGYDPFDIKQDRQQLFYSKAGGPTIDQVVADLVGQETLVRSVQLGNSKQLSIMDSGTTMHALSHRGQELPLYPEFNPQLVYQYLFGTLAQGPGEAALRRSSLDLVAQQTATLRKRLGALDQQRLDAHLQGIYQLESKLASSGVSCELPELPEEDNSQLFPEPLISVHEAMVELLGYAFACDITRVGSYLFHGGAAETVFSEAGQSSVHHTNTHQTSSTPQAAVRDAIVFNMDRLAYLLQRFNEWEDGSLGTSLLDRTVVYFSSDCSDGWSHSVLRQPIIVAGGGELGLVYPGIHHQELGRNVSDILLSVLQVFDETATQVGGGAPASTTPVTELKAG